MWLLFFSLREGFACYLILFLYWCWRDIFIWIFYSIWSFLEKNKKKHFNFIFHVECCHFKEEENIYGGNDFDGQLTNSSSWFPIDFLTNWNYWKKSMKFLLQNIMKFPRKKKLCLYEIQNTYMWIQFDFFFHFDDLFIELHHLCNIFLNALEHF